MSVPGFRIGASTRSTAPDVSSDRPAIAMMGLWLTFGIAGFGQRVV